MNDDEKEDVEARELQQTLRAVSATVLLVLFSLLVVAAVLTPLLTDEVQDTTLILGLSASILGALAAFLGVTLAIRRNHE